MLTAYIDESYNKRTFCVGGWLCPDEKWTEIERRWADRISYERRISAKKHQTPISRFHASDCATFGGEFREWTQSRQVRLMKKLTEIIGETKPFGIAVAAQLGDFVSGYPQQEEQRHKGCYFFCMMAVLLLIGDCMADHFPQGKVKVIYDRGSVSRWAAQRAYTSAKNDPGWRFRGYLTSIAPMGWEDCVPLQAADLLAYEGYKAIDRHALGSRELRRSLQSILGHKVQLSVQSYQADAFQKLAQMQTVMQSASENPTVDLKRIMAQVTSGWRGRTTARLRVG